MNHDYGSFWNLIEDFQSLIAGFLTLVAGTLAFVGAKQQSGVVREQTRYLQTEAKRGLARSVVLSARLLDGALAAMGEDLAKLDQLLSQPVFNRESGVIVPEPKTLLRKPSLQTVWSDLGRCSQDAIVAYIALDLKADSFRDCKIIGPQWHLTQVREMRPMVAHLREIIGEDAVKANRYLARK